MKRSKRAALALVIKISSADRSLTGRRSGDRSSTCRYPQESSYKDRVIRNSLVPSTGFSRYPRYLGTAKVIRLLPIGSPNDTSKTVAGARISFFLFSGVAIEKQRLVDQRVYGGRLNRSFSGEQISNCCLSLTVTGSKPGVTPPETDSLHTARPHHHSLILHPDYY